MSHYTHISPAEESRNLRSREAAANHTGRLATAHQLAYRTGRDMTHWLEDEPETPEETEARRQRRVAAGLEEAR